MSNSPEQPVGTQTALTERFDTESAKVEPMIVYKDADGSTRQEHPCPRCVEQFFFSEELRSLISKILTFHFVAEKFVVYGWIDYSGMSGRSDYRWMEYIAAIARAIRSFAESLSQLPSAADAFSCSSGFTIQHSTSHMSLISLGKSG